MPKKLRASIIGVTGYTGLELLRVLLAHPSAEIVYLTSRQHEDAAIGDVYPHLSGYDFRITNTDAEKVAEDSDVVFLCLPHKTAQDTVAQLYGKTKIIDLSADYRLEDADIYERYYGLPHAYPELLGKAVYGAPEFHRADIAKADLVANPGCFALLCQLLLYPFKDNIQHVDIMAITGSSGSGKSASDGTHHPVRDHNMKSYNVNMHRHTPEITRTAGITAQQMNFVPTSGPFVRGIFAQAFVTLKDNADICAADLYAPEPFVRVGDSVALANIVGSNYADLSFHQGHDGRILAQGALDNLVKGAAGCAVQNMNIMFGLDETAGLKILGPLYP